MRSPFVVVSSSGLDLLPGVLKQQKPVRIQALVPEAAVERLNEGIIDRFFQRACLRLTEREGDLLIREP
jgi:hypothetical protein